MFEAMRDHELAKLGEMTTRSARIDLTLLGHTQIRNFPKFPRTGEQLIEMPMSILLRSGWGENKRMLYFNAKYVFPGAGRLIR